MAYYNPFDPTKQQQTTTAQPQQPSVAPPPPPASKPPLGLPSAPQTQSTTSPTAVMDRMAEDMTSFTPQTQMQQVQTPPPVAPPTTGNVAPPPVKPQAQYDETGQLIHTPEWDAWAAQNDPTAAAATAAGTQSGIDNYIKTIFQNPAATWNPSFNFNGTPISLQQIQALGFNPLVDADSSGQYDPPGYNAEPGQAVGANTYTGNPNPPPLGTTNNPGANPGQFGVGGSGFGMPAPPPVPFPTPPTGAPSGLTDTTGTVPLPVDRLADDLGMTLPTTDPNQIIAGGTPLGPSNPPVTTPFPAGHPGTSTGGTNGVPSPSDLDNITGTYTPPTSPGGTTPDSGGPPAIERNQFNFSPLPDFESAVGDQVAALEQRLGRLREQGTRNVAEVAASRGVLGGSPELGMLTDLETELGLQGREALTGIAREAMGFKLQARAQELQQQGMQADDSFRYAALEQDQYFQNEALQLQKLGMSQDEAFRYAALSQDGAFQQKSLDLQKYGIDKANAMRVAEMAQDLDKFNRSLAQGQTQFDQTTQLERQRLAAQIVEMMYGFKVDPSKYPDWLKTLLQQSGA